MEDKKLIYQEANKLWGFQKQSIKVFEEFGELMQKLSKFLINYEKYKKHIPYSLLEEIADCENVLDILKFNLNNLDSEVFKVIEKIKIKKLDRMKQRIKGIKNGVDIDG